MRGNNGGSPDKDEAAATLETSPAPVGLDLLWNHPDITDCGRSSIWRRAGSVARAYGDHAAAGDGGHVRNRREFWKNGECLSVHGIGLHIHQLRIKPSSGICSRLGHVSGIFIPADTKRTIRGVGDPTNGTTISFLAIGGLDRRTYHLHDRARD